jgi:hypothetical protein
MGSDSIPRLTPLPTLNLRLHFLPSWPAAACAMCRQPHEEHPADDFPCQYGRCGADFFVNCFWRWDAAQTEEDPFVCPGCRN